MQKAAGLSAADLAWLLDKRMTALSRQLVSPADLKFAEFLAKQPSESKAASERKS